MRYEYEDEIIMNLKDYNAGRKVTGGTHAFESKLEELDLVYTQAAKANEYEAKAKAFDAIMREWEDERMTKSHILETIQKYYDESLSEGHMADDVCNIIEKYESGDPND